MLEESKKNRGHGATGKRGHGATGQRGKGGNGGNGGTGAIGEGEGASEKDKAERRHKGSETQEAREGTIVVYPPRFNARAVHATFSWALLHYDVKHQHTSMTSDATGGLQPFTPQGGRCRPGGGGV